MTPLPRLVLPAKALACLALLVAVAGAVHRFTPAGLAPFALAALALLAVAALPFWQQVAAGALLSLSGRLARGGYLVVSAAGGELRGTVARATLRCVHLVDEAGVVHEVPHTLLLVSPLSLASPDAAPTPCHVEVTVPSHLSPGRALVVAREVAGLSAYASLRFRPEATLAPSREPEGPLRLVVRGFPARPELARELESDLLMMLDDALRAEGPAKTGGPRA